mmetsp:Transcript_17939/g.50139  ORF Transcript_17939/g.50139 Transcript_17939/m.50139 type:complete len:210 (+) Transcript_17939:471-1100(+)
MDAWVAQWGNGCTWYWRGRGLDGWLGWVRGCTWRGGSRGGRGELVQGVEGLDERLEGGRARWPVGRSQVLLLVQVLQGKAPHGKQEVGEARGEVAMVAMRHRPHEGLQAGRHLSKVVALVPDDPQQVPHAAKVIAAVAVQVGHKLSLQALCPILRRRTLGHRGTRGCAQRSAATRFQGSQEALVRLTVFILNPVADVQQELQALLCAPP